MCATPRFVIRVHPRLLLLCSVVFFVPVVYLLLLPLLASTDPFRTYTFAAAITNESTSISQYLSNAPANGGFAAFTAPIIAYAWLNPISRRSVLAQMRASIFTFGWLLSTLLPCWICIECSASCGVLRRRAWQYCVCIFSLDASSGILVPLDFFLPLGMQHCFGGRPLWHIRRIIYSVRVYRRNPCCGLCTGCQSCWCHLTFARDLPGRMFSLVEAIVEWTTDNNE